MKKGKNAFPRFVPMVILIPILCFLGLQGEIDYHKLHFDSLVVDAHNDVVHRILDGENIAKRTNHGHSDLPRFKEGGIDVQIFSIWVPPQEKADSNYQMAITQIDSIESFIKQNSNDVILVRNSTDIEQ